MNTLEQAVNEIDQLRQQLAEAQQKIEKLEDENGTQAGTIALLQKSRAEAEAARNKLDSIDTGYSEGVRGLVRRTAVEVILDDLAALLAAPAERHKP